jgi:hypothetical protein
MTEENNVRELHPAQPEQTLEHWKELPRAEWFERLILTVECCRDEGEALGDEATMRRCDEQIEFLEAEIERARKAERASNRAPTYQAGVSFGGPYPLSVGAPARFLPREKSGCINAEIARGCYILRVSSNTGVTSGGILVKKANRPRWFEALSPSAQIKKPHLGGPGRLEKPRTSLLLFL